VGRTTALRAAQRYGLGGRSGKGRGREVAAVGHRADRLAGGRAEEAWRRPGRRQLRRQLGRAEDSRRAGLPGTPPSPSLYLSLGKKGGERGVRGARSLTLFVSVGSVCGGGQEGTP